MAGLTQAEITKIWDKTQNSAFSTKQLATSLNIAYKKLYDFVKSQRAKLIFLVQKDEGILWVRANPTTPLNLIFDKQKAKETEFASGQPCGKIEKPNSTTDLKGLKHASPERWKVAHKLSRCNGFGYVDQETGDFVFTNNIYQESITGFGDYITRIRQENIEMAHSMDGNPVFSAVVHLPYKTRFTSIERQEEIRRAYRLTWEYASKRHLKAVFLTLTAPGRAGDLWHVNQQMLKAWDRLRALLSSKLPRKLTYICVREFQKNGRLHFHVVIFGLNWLLPIKVLRHFWVSYGGGPVINICAMRQTPEGWTWARQAPKEAGRQAPIGFISEYLEKSMSPKSGALYWAFNIQYWTASRDIKQSPEKHESKGIWARVGVVSKKGKRIFQKGKAHALVKGALLRTRKKSEPKPDNTTKKKKKLDLSFRRACELNANP